MNERWFSASRTARESELFSAPPPPQSRIRIIFYVAARQHQMSAHRTQIFDTVPAEAKDDAHLSRFILSLSNRLPIVCCCYCMRLFRPRDANEGGEVDGPQWGCQSRFTNHPTLISNFVINSNYWSNKDSAESNTLLGIRLDGAELQPYLAFLLPLNLCLWKYFEQFGISFLISLFNQFNP